MTRKMEFKKSKPLKKLQKFVLSRSKSIFFVIFGLLNNKILFSVILYITFYPKKFFRLSVGNEVRLKGAYIIKANEVLLDENQAVTEILCTYDPKSKSGSGSEESKRKVKSK